MFGTLDGGEVVQAGGSVVDVDNFVFAPEPAVPAEMREGLKPEELEQMDAGRGLFGEPEKFERTFENRDAPTVGSTMVAKDSSIGVLRAAADFLGISKGGSKSSLWTRLNQAVQQLENQQLFQDANRMYHEQGQHRGLQLQPALVNHLNRKEYHDGLYNHGLFILALHELAALHGGDWK